MDLGRTTRVARAPGTLMALVALAVAGLGGIEVAPARRPPPPDADVRSACAVPAGRTLRMSVVVDGQGPRSALVHIPGRRHGRIPLVLALHGAYGSGAFMERYSGLSRVADREGFGVVYPDARGSFWRISADEDGADVQFLDAVLDGALSGGCFDDRHVAAVGVSNGAGMAARFACAGDDRLAGLVAVAGGYGSLPACRARRPLSVMEIHGTADAVVPYRGRPRDRRGDVLRWLGRWVDLDRCPRVPRRTRPTARILRLDWGPCRDATAVEHLRLLSGTHAWPGAEPPDPGPAFGISASEEAWRFLAGRRLAAPVREHDAG